MTIINTMNLCKTFNPCQQHTSTDSSVYLSTGYVVGQPISLNKLKFLIENQLVPNMHMYYFNAD